MFCFWNKNLQGLDKPDRFFTIVYKIPAFLHTKPLLKGVYSKRKRLLFAPKGSKFFSFRSDHFQKQSTNILQATSHENESSHPKQKQQQQTHSLYKPPSSKSPLSSPRKSLLARFLLYQDLGNDRISPRRLMSYLNAADPISHTAEESMQNKIMLLELLSKKLAMNHSNFQ